MAGSAALTPLLVVPEEHAVNKRALRQYYHEKLAPASDIDLFLYGIEDEKEAIAKLEAIETTVRDNLLWETTYVPAHFHPKGMGLLTVTVALANQHHSHP